MTGGDGKRPTARATALVAFSACCFGSISVLTVLATTRGGTSLPNLLFWRYALALAGFALVMAARGARADEPRPGPAQTARLVLLGGAGQAAVAALSLSSLRWISAATLGFLFYTYPAWVALFAALRRTDAVDARRAIALVLSLAGTTLMVGLPAAGGGGTQLAWPGVALALAAAITYALYIPLLGRISAAAGPVGGSACVAAGAALLLGGWALVDGALTVRMSPLAWGAASTLALLCTVLAFVAFLSGLGVLGPVRAAIVSTVEPFWTAVLGAVLLAQPITLPTVGGGVLIAAAVLLLQLPPRRAAAAAAG